MKKIIKINRLFILLITIFSVLFYGCNDSYTSNQIILKAEKLMEESPDSAYILLQSIPFPEKLPEKDYMAWALQNTYSEYYLDYGTTSDNIISDVANYYAGNNDSKHAGLAFYLSGYINELSGKNEVAIIAYKEALNYFSQINDVRMYALCCQNIGHIYTSEGYYDEALNYFLQMLDNYKVTNNSFDLAYAYCIVGETYKSLYYPIDTTLSFFDKSIEYALQLHDSTYYYDILNLKGYALLNTKYEEAKNIFLQVYQSDSEKYISTTIYLAYLYTYLNQPDSAIYFYNKAVADSILSNSYWDELAGAYVESYQHNYKGAFIHLESAFKIADSLNNQRLKGEVLRIEKQYDLAQQQKKNAELTVRSRTWLAMSMGLLSLLLFAIAFSFYILSKRRKKELLLLEQTKEQEKELEKTKFNNEQKRQQLFNSLSMKAENTLRFSKINAGLQLFDKIDDFIEDITRQSIIGKEDRDMYIREVNGLTEGKLFQLSTDYPDLTQTDLIVIALTYLGYGVADVSNLLNISIQTMYSRRKRIKQRVDNDEKINFENWVTNVLGENSILNKK